MLRVGLTGGIGSGKSTVAARLVHHGATLVDSDRLAREVVAPGTPGLAAVVDAFGDGVLDADGALDRPALAAVVFDDADARARLNGIVHPLVRRRSVELVAAAPADGVVVQDIPLLVEGRMAAHFPLVVVVHADAEDRVRRLVQHRGMPAADARARIAAQVDDAQRRAAADVWLDNAGSRTALVAAVDALWDGRLAPFAANLRAGRAATWSTTVVPADPDWTAQGRRFAARVAAAVGDRGLGVTPVGPTAVAGLAAPDVIDLQLGVADPADARDLDGALREIGFVPAVSASGAVSRALRSSWVAAGPADWATADPGRPARLHVQVVDSSGWRDTRLVRDWLRADPDARRAHRECPDGDPEHADASTFAQVVARARRWAASSGWVASLDEAQPSDGAHPRGGTAPR